MMLLPHEPLLSHRRLMEIVASWVAGGARDVAVWWPPIPCPVWRGKDGVER